MDIDVLIPCAGTAEYFSAALSSALAQSQLPRAIYVLDNASSHQRYNEIARSVESPLIHYIRFEERLKMTANWQRCLEIGNSPFFICLHDDDIWDLNVLARSAEIMAGDCNITACLLGHAPFNDSETEDDRVKAIQKREKDFEFVKNLEEPLRSLVLCTSNLGHMCALVCKRQAIGYPLQNSFMPDQGFLALHAAYGQIEIDSKVTVHIRQHSNSVTTRYTGNSRSSFEMISQIRQILAYQIENRDLQPQSLLAIADQVPRAYLFRILQACHSWPLRPTLLKFARGVIDAKQRGREFDIREFFGVISWFFMAIVADWFYFRNERPPD